MKEMTVVDNFIIEPETLTYKTCPECGGRAGEIINMERNFRQGWLCVPCAAFQVAIMRERTCESR